MCAKKSHLSTAEKDQISRITPEKMQTLLILVKIIAIKCKKKSPVYNIPSAAIKGDPVL